jgi:hypothetical protein
MARTCPDAFDRDGHGTANDTPTGNRHLYLTRISHYALEMRNLDTVFSRPCRSFSPYRDEDSLFGETERRFGVRAACWRFPFRKLACETSNHRLNLHASYLGTFQPSSLREPPPIFDSSFPIDSQPASWLGKSGSKLHALQSFAPNASDAKSTPALARLDEKSGLANPVPAAYRLQWEALFNRDS